MSTDGVTVDSDALREQVKEKYREVATHPDREFHFHTGRSLATRAAMTQDLWLRSPTRRWSRLLASRLHSRFGRRAGEQVVDVGSGAGMDSFLAATSVGPRGPGYRCRDHARDAGGAQQCAPDGFGESSSFVSGVAEELPIEDAWADTVIANGVLNLVRISSARSPKFGGCCDPVGCCSSPTLRPAYQYRS